MAAGRGRARFLTDSTRGKANSIGKVVPNQKSDADDNHLANANRALRARQEAARRRQQKRTTKAGEKTTAAEGQLSAHEPPGDSRRIWVRPESEAIGKAGRAERPPHDAPPPRPSSDHTDIRDWPIADVLAAHFPGPWTIDARLSALGWCYADQLPVRCGTCGSPLHALEILAKRTASVVAVACPTCRSAVPLNDYAPDVAHKVRQSLA